MQITTDNLDKSLYDNGYLVVARIGDSGDVHYGKFFKHETISYGRLESYSHADDVVRSLIPNGQWDGAVIHYAPHSKRYTVKRGEVL